MKLRWGNVARLVWRGTVVTVLFGAVPFYTIALLRKPSRYLLYDFHGGLFNAGAAILHGLSPYQPGFLAHQAAIMRAGGIAIGETTQHAFSIPVYPAPANLAIVPLALLPYSLAGALYTLISIAALVLAIWLLGIRDWRCFAVALLSWPFLYGLYLGAVGPFLLLGAAVAWRWRQRLWPPALAIASIIVAKVFPWPLAVWLLITRRFKAFALAVSIGVVVTFGAWALIGFDGLVQYPQMLSNLSIIQEGRAASLVAVLLALGLSPAAASALAMLAGVAMLVGAGRIAAQPDGERRAFGLVILAALTATPIVWDHYMVLLFVPIALASPRLSALWFVPLWPPVIIAASAAVFPLTGGLQTTELRPAAVWLLLEAFVAIRLVAPAGTRLGLRVPGAARRPPATAAVTGSAELA